MMKMTPARGVYEFAQGPKRSCSSSSGDPTKYKQKLKAPPPDRPVARVMQLYYALHLALRRCLIFRKETMQ
jgi:hypothetical protein